ncbi:MAG: hypothetical protein J2P15_04035 [Micromonosporaceae bacterium]|nr:hypothetical protein [Micromonosporaceae bacterium]
MDEPAQDWAEVDEWIVRLPAVLDVLRDVGREENFDPDFSGGSLVAIERRLLDWYGTPDELRDQMRQHEQSEWLVEGVAGYLGEMLLRLAGGGWRPANEPGFVPAIEADPALRLPELSPFDLVLSAVRERTGDRLGRQYADWAQAVAAYRAEHPDWAPVKRLTPGVDPLVAEQAEVEYLSTWLADRQEAFPGWVQRYGAGIVWDFSARSLDDLGSLVLRVTPTPADLSTEEHRSFVAGAEWYTGEALRRIRGGRWCYRHGDPEIHLYAGHPYVDLEPSGAGEVPYVGLQALVERRDPHLLRRAYENHAE